MLLKIIGSIMIMSGSSFIGFAMSSCCSKRPGQLKNLQNLMQMLENEIRYLSSIISDAFEKIYKSIDNPVNLFFKSTLEYLENREELNLAQAWERAIKDNIYKTSLNKEDEEILVSFGKMLGNSDIEGQIKNIRFTIYQLSLQEQKAEELKKRNETMYRTLGILGGATAVILLI
ncbi:MAG TPA: stage III sporulation protein SpoIIIAB [Clostridiales bacterium]|nr:stage III sporulation protein SpoIIIAB [Clostridiales bacterium]